LAGNRIIGLAASAQLLKWTTSNNLTRSTISRNKLTLGSVSLPFNQVVVVTENIFTTVTGSIVDNGGCVIANNPRIAGSDACWVAVCGELQCGGAISVVLRG
jgi:hypothetical protein